MYTTPKRPYLQHYLTFYHQYLPRIKADGYKGFHGDKKSHQRNITKR